MKTVRPFPATIFSKSIFLYLLFFSWILIGCKKEVGNSGVAVEENANVAKPAKLAKDFVQVNLVGNNNEYGARFIEPTLINPWGLAWSPTGIAWPASQGSGFSQVLRRDGSAVRAPVAIPTFNMPTGGNPTGIVFNPTADFKLSSNNLKANFIFAGVDGVISGWNGGNFAIRMVNNVANSAYTGLALANDGTGNFLYAADFRGGEIDVFDGNFQQVNKAFVDPGLPAGYAPFNIQSIDNWLYVLYAKVGPDGRDEPGNGFGYVSVFNPNGSFVKRFLSRGELNAPWGITKAAASFFGDDNDGKHAAETAILVGNFGDGQINAYTPGGDHLGTLRAHGKPISIEGLWAISFLPSGAATAEDKDRLYFTAGPDEETSGIFGYLKK